jgi:hypothetical protein
VTWPVCEPLLSEQDSRLPILADVPAYFSVKTGNAAP